MVYIGADHVVSVVPGTVPSCVSVKLIDGPIHGPKVGDVIVSVISVNLIAEGPQFRGIPKMGKDQTTRTETVMLILAIRKQFVNDV